MQRTWKPTVAGVLELAAGVFGLTRGALLLKLPFILGWQFAHALAGPGPMFARFFQSGFFHILAFGHLAGGALAIVGGIFTLQRKSWVMALVGAVAAVFASFPLGVVAVILAAMSEREFRTVAPIPPSTP
jgi:hypothetical protein